MGSRSQGLPLDDVVLPLEAVAPLVELLLDVDVSIPPLLVELVELLDDVELFTGLVETRPPPSGVPVPSPLPPLEDDDADEVEPPVAVEPPRAVVGSLPSASVTGGWSSPAP